MSLFLQVRSRTYKERVAALCHSRAGENPRYSLTFCAQLGSRVRENDEEATVRVMHACMGMDFILRLVDTGTTQLLCLVSRSLYRVSAENRCGFGHIFVYVYDAIACFYRVVATVQDGLSQCSRVCLGRIRVMRWCLRVPVRYPCLGSQAAQQGDAHDDAECWRIDASLR